MPLDLTNLSPEDIKNMAMGFFLGLFNEQVTDSDLTWQGIEIVLASMNINKDLTPQQIGRAIQRIQKFR